MKNQNQSFAFDYKSIFFVNLLTIKIFTILKLIIMKRTLLLFELLFLFSISAFSQAFVSEDNQWNVRMSFFMSPSMEIYIVQGDSLHNMISYQKMWMSYDSTLSGLMYQGLVREDNNVVYYVPHDATEGVLYDFNLEEGETVNLKNVFCGDMELEATVVEIDTVEYFGIERKRWQLECDGWTEYWLDGIGSLSGPLHSFYPLCIICPVWDLLCFHENDDLLYIMPGQTNCYQTSVGIEEQLAEPTCKILPNPVNQGQHFEIESSQGIRSISIYNSVGLLVKQIFSVPKEGLIIETDNLKPGLYLVKIEIWNKQKITKKLLVL